jgi:hypothetical protein
MSAIQSGGHKRRSITNLYSPSELVCHFCEDGSVASLAKEEGKVQQSNCNLQRVPNNLEPGNVDSSAHNCEYAGEHPSYLDSYHARYSAPRIAEGPTNCPRNPA